MQSDEQLYELVAKELATSPRQGLLIKCMAKSDGEENKGKALYIETRVAELKKEITEEIKKKKAEEKEAKIKASGSEEITQEEKRGLVILLIVTVITFAIAFFSDIFKST